MAGIRHGMGGLTRACEDHLAAALTPASAPDVLYLAHKYGATSLREDALEYAVRKVSLAGRVGRRPAGRSSCMA